ncbi:MAG: pro-sigmaK processing inhibitor BofA family protein [Clostridium sp.]|nr:pro-sigmaK processing inhibitor BofA family protein [Clostridium sp.]MCM1548289.1 pro-sigmaK processing inhibitor BofA family protein [Ruminococcus sp.]
MNEMLFKAILAAAGLVMIIYYAKRKHTIKSAVFGMASGGISLLLMHYLGNNLGYAPPVNLFNTAVSLVLGIPGTALIMAANII